MSPDNDVMPFDASFWADPNSGWDRLREGSGVLRIRTPEGPPAWLVTRYRDVHAGLLDRRLSVAREHARGGDYKGFDLPAHLESHLLNRDGVDHARLRRLVTPALSSHRVQASGAAIAATCDRLLDGVSTRSPVAVVDLVRELAVPLPLEVVCDLLAIPAGPRADLHAWAQRLLDPRPVQAPRARDSLATMRALVGQVIQARRDSPGPDLVSELIAAGTDGERISDDELSAMIFYLLFVWLEVSVDLLSNGLLTLLLDPSRLALLRERPDLLAAAVEEMLRHESPQALATPRFPLVDITISGQRIPAGDTVLLALASANRDPAAVASPQVFDITRSPNPHVSLGAGLHRCLGAPLVRLQTQIVVDRLLARFDDLQLAVTPQQLRWREGLRHRGVRELPVRLSLRPDPSRPE